MSMVDKCHPFDTVTHMLPAYSAFLRRRTSTRSHFALEREHPVYGAEHDHFTVTRSGRPHVMVVSVAEWDELQETLAILSDSETRVDLTEAAGAAELGDFTTEDEMQVILDARLRRSGEW